MTSALQMSPLGPEWLSAGSAISWAHGFRLFRECDPLLLLLYGDRSATAVVDFS